MEHLTPVKKRAGGLQFGPEAGRQTIEILHDTPGFSFVV